MGGVRQTEMHTAEPFLPELSTSEVKAAIGKLKRCKLPGVDSIPAELIQEKGETFYSEILPHQWKELTVIPVHKKDVKTDCSNY
jgi:hypothetical protein